MKNILIYILTFSIIVFTSCHKNIPVEINSVNIITNNEVNNSIIINSYKKFFYPIKLDTTKRIHYQIYSLKRNIITNGEDTINIPSTVEFRGIQKAIKDFLGLNKPQPREVKNSRHEYFNALDNRDIIEEIKALDKLNLGIYKIGFDGNNLIYCFVDSKNKSNNNDFCKNGEFKDTTKLITQICRDIVKSSSPNSSNLYIYFIKDIVKPNESPIISDTSFAIFDNIPVGYELGKINATDPNQDSVFYKILSGNANNAFQLDHKTGILSIADNKSLRRNISSDFELIVEVSDNGKPLMANQAKITINFAENKNPVINDQNFKINEICENGTLVGRILASDPDPGQRLYYKIISGNSDSVFEINRYNGYLTVFKSDLLDYKSKPVHELKVVVEDNGTLKKSNSASIKINITERPICEVKIENVYIKNNNLLKWDYTPSYNKCNPQFIIEFIDVNTKNIIETKTVGTNSFALNQNLKLLSKFKQDSSGYFKVIITSSGYKIVQNTKESKKIKYFACSTGFNFKLTE